MADAWGGAWGSAWGQSWGSGAVVQQTDAVAGGFFLRKLPRIEEPEDALQIIETHGTEAQQARAVDIRPLLQKLEHAKNLLDAEQKRRARAEAKWALAIANQIRQEREDEDVGLALLLLH